MAKQSPKIVLVGVIKNQRDLDILFQENWYRIPLEFLPKRKFHYLAFYQPEIFQNDGKQIKYFAKILGSEVKKRIELLPEEPMHERANADYSRIKFAEIHELEKPVRNIIPRRITFGYTTLKKLKNAGDILELYSVAPIEQILERGLKKIGIKAIAQFYELINSEKRFRLDLAIFCQNGKIAIECDNQKSHTTKLQLKRDRQKTALLERCGWTVMRFRENEIVDDLGDCLESLCVKITLLGGEI